MIWVATILSLLALGGVIYLLFRVAYASDLKSLEEQTPRVIDGEGEIDSILIHKNKIIYKKLKEEE